MPASPTRWSLGAKLAAVGLPFMVLGLLVTALTLWVSWQLDGGAAAVNEAGRMRMQAYRLAWVSTLANDPAQRPRLVEEFEHSLQVLAKGDPERPLMTPWDDDVRSRYQAVRTAWDGMRALHATPAPLDSAGLNQATAALVATIDGLVQAIEVHLARYTSILHLLQVVMMVLGTVAASLFVVIGYHVVLEPVLLLKQAVSQVRTGDFEARVEPGASDELGELAVGFNDMARQLQASYTDLEQRVREKTAELQEKRERLQSLYDVSLLVARSGSLDELAQGFVRLVGEAARADGAVLRWFDATRGQFVLLASMGLPATVATDEHCIPSGDCHCGQSEAPQGARVIVLHELPPVRRQACASAGWASLVAIPMHAKDRLIGELDLFFHAEHTLTEAEQALLETMTTHLVAGMENLRLQAAEREAAVAEERGFLARELHDSIAQSLAFLNIQAQLMRKAMADGDRARMNQALAEIELGLRESHGDVRELLIHFRTRTDAQDMEHALLATLRKFEHQSGLASTFTVHDEGLPLAPDLQVQALHIVQEALSNVRKHAAAGHVWVDVWKHPAWRIEVRDDGRGFAADALPPDTENHVGLRIMRERAERLGARLDVSSRAGQGTTVRLELEPAAAEARPARLATG
jgi:two-component system nitrate/nitrite sensor histidine kinase NarX